MNTVFRSTFAGVAAGTALLGGLSAPAAAYAARPAVRVEVQTAAGSGCPTPADTSVTPHLDGSGFLAVYNAFEASSPPNGNRFCNLTLKVSTDAGVHVGLRRITYRGTADLGRNSRGSFEAKYFWAGGPTAHHPGYSRTGPYSGDWERVHELPEVHWGPCHEAQLNITQTLRAKGPGEAYINVQSTDAGYASIFEWVTAPC
ncbi:hypothetical protein GCM10010124_19120 [Pilimelia terevasa]|uniref:DUF4360 domain-containing protein n=1 Tax=Pilimelia terevasa TaxID=53372 RepID=A0A8J3FK48_9ACTN|nr:DUF4360 domain-containing protein [Pilimelia terevasa]GGK26625.1 hypothetical protein GCM10010124_19120 [Pilimelia terevasa]